MKKTPVEFTQTFPGIPCVSQMLGGPFLKLGIPPEQPSIPSRSRKGGSNADWLGTWDCPLRNESASWKIHAINCILWFLKPGCALLTSVLIFDQSSSRKFIDSYFLISSILPFHEIWNELHEDPDSFLINVLEVGVDLVGVAHRLL